MTRTPDEIKKGLEEEIPVHYHIDGEPRLTPRMLMDMQWLHKDALALVQQLQAENAEQAEKIRALEDRVKQHEAERDETISILRGAGCDTCQYREVDSWEEPCLYCMNRERWEWIGLQKD